MLNCQRMFGERGVIRRRTMSDKSKQSESVQTNKQDNETKTRHLLTTQLFWNLKSTLSFVPFTHIRSRATDATIILHKQVRQTLQLSYTSMQIPHMVTTQGHPFQWTSRFGESIEYVRPFGGCHVGEIASSYPEVTEIESSVWLSWVNPIFICFFYTECVVVVYR